MKAIRTILLVALVVSFGGAFGRAFAQAPDTIWVAASPAGNINDFIQGDTLGNGSRAHPNAVYKLYMDSIYYYTGTINVSFPLAIIADTGSSHRPPIIAPAILQDNSSPSTLFNVLSGARSFTFKNIYSTGVRPDQKVNNNYSNFVNIVGDSTRFVFDNCVFDNLVGAAIVVGSGNYNKFFMTNCVFRNMIPYTQYFYGQAFLSGGGAPTDTVEMINNTFFCINAYADANVYYNTYTRFEHNTVFLTAVNPLNDFVMTNAVYKNNIFYGTAEEAQTQNEILGDYQDDTPYGTSTFSFDSLNVYLPVATLGLSEGARKILVENNSVFWSQTVRNFWATPLMDTLVPPYVFNGRTQRMFNNKTAWPGLYQAGNDSVADPGFLSAVTTQEDSLIKYVQLTRTNALGTYLWDYDPGNAPLFPPAWPLPENLRYTNSTFIHGGTDGYALGDLRWFPEQKATWVLGVKSQPNDIPTKFDLSSNYPNPFNPSTNIKVDLKQPGLMSLKVYNILGQLVKVVDEGYKQAGTYVYNVSMDQYSSGVYFYTLQQGANSMTKKMMLLK
ncbi:MAG TPA: T9SS type A sorting domain-containing protein [Candidatus Acidoferrales bacterium]|nr:T9SS type A sorting domain-containing protein [Candidatus Acidoferrales bacterium]